MFLHAVHLEMNAFDLAASAYENTKMSKLKRRTRNTSSICHFTSLCSSYCQIHGTFWSFQKRYALLITLKRTSKGTHCFNINLDENKDCIISEGATCNGYKFALRMTLSQIYQHPHWQILHNRHESWEWGPIKDKHILLNIWNIWCAFRSISWESSIQTLNKAKHLGNQLLWLWCQAFLSKDENLPHHVCRHVIKHTILMNLPFSKYRTTSEHRCITIQF